MVSTNAKDSSSNKRPRKKPRTMPKKSSQNNLRFQANTVGSGPELKNDDVVGTYATTAAGLFVAPAAGQLLNGITQGSSETQRVGRKIQMKSLILNYVYAPASNTTCDSFRVLIVYDKQPIGVFPAITDILQTSSELSPMNLAYSDRFTVLHNEIVTQPSVSNEYLGNIYVKMNLDAIYSSTGGLIANINTGAIYVMWASATSATASMTFYSRVRYTDA